MCFAATIGKTQSIGSDNYDCPTSSYVNSEKFITYYLNENLDSAQFVINDWVEKCGYREVVIRAQTLLDFRKDDRTEINSNSFFSLIEFIHRDTISGIRTKYFYEYNRPYYSYIPISESYDKFTKVAFDKLPNQKSNELELVRKVYSGNYQNFFEDLKSPDLNGSSLQKSYNNYINDNIKLTEGHYSIFTGMWIPISESTLGSHPEIGFQLGMKKRKWNYDLTILFRFLKSKNEYQVLRKQTNQFEPTNLFFGGYMGIETGYDIIQHKKHEIQIVGGIGFDGFDALKQSGELNAVSTFSYNLNFGAKWRKYINSNSYFGLGIRYNIIDYSIRNKVNFNEYPISINVIYGFVSNRIKSQNLNQVGYKLRE